MQYRRAKNPGSSYFFTLDIGDILNGFKNWLGFTKRDKSKEITIYNKILKARFLVVYLDAKLWGIYQMKFKILFQN
jgi:hypothetical protein